jgi:nitrite reductase/ring-hydroxylating ferredoxin subunit
VRRRDRVDVLEDRCTHRGAPLSDGTLVGECIECPWHASRFRTNDGTVLGGPASIEQPAYDTRLADGWVEIRRSEPGGLRRLRTGAHRDAG